MGFRVYIVIFFCSPVFFAFSKEKDHLTEKRDSTEKHIVERDSCTKIILKEDTIEHIRLDDTLVFDDQEAPKSRQNSLILNKKTSEYDEQNDTIIDTEDNEEEFNAKPKTFNLLDAGPQQPVEVFPNPSVAKSAIHLILPYPAGWEITITQINGQAITQRLTTENTALLLEIPVKGAYIVNAIEGNTILYKQLIVQ
jgi:hypothetical protein